MEEPVRLQSMGSQRVGHGLSDFTSLIQEPRLRERLASRAFQSLFGVATGCSTVRGIGGGSEPVGWLASNGYPAGLEDVRLRWPCGALGTCFPSTSQQTYVIAIVTPISRWQDGVRSGPGLASQAPLT